MQSIIQSGTDCFLCGRPETEEYRNDEHHCLSGRNRKIADKYGLTVYLCRKCHSGIHNAKEGSPYKEAEDVLHRVAQQEFEKRHSHQKWMDEVGRNYL